MRPVPALALALSAAALAVTAGSASAAPTPGSRVHVITAKSGLTSYKPELVPPGARAHVFGLTSKASGTSVAVLVTGLLPGREYGAHAHTNPCGATGDLAGPHYQNVEDPVKPSVDPAYANPRNEIWLDLTADATGRGVAVSKVDWTFGARRANSIVIHETHTHTDPGHAGTAGARLACVTVGF
ncbi:superoxide dismutase family protein [Amycolatopsis pittospori]|uniref:superoxide dismutase family protein n=1 Tax=Amycolatopsis pittospori TaxID=2749434 RepID=UPI0015F11F46|nr:superoxide dismutase family protein [Amycolatopsis pittospori]